jgi:hypothetical protein
MLVDKNISNFLWANKMIIRSNIFSLSANAQCQIAIALIEHAI